MKTRKSKRLRKQKNKIAIVGSIFTLLFGTVINNAVFEKNAVFQSGALKAHAATTGPTVTITPQNFTDYFKLSGSATYNSSNGILTLTQNTTSQVGMAAMNVKFDMSQNWEVRGFLNIGRGNPSPTNQPYADGIGFGWYPGNTGEVGLKGGNLGIGGLRGAFGWTADTYKNTYQIPSTLPNQSPNADPVYTLTDRGIAGGDPAIPGQSTNAPWAAGGWAYANPNPQYDAPNSTVTNPDGSTYPAQAPKTAYNRSDNPQQSIFPLADNQFHPYTLNYNATSKTVTVTYGTQTWTMPISTLETLAGNQPGSDALSFFISGSTGGSRNLQQFQFTSATFTEALGNVTSNYVDEAGKTISPSDTTQGQVGKAPGYTAKPKTIPGYTLVRSDNTDKNATNNNNTYTGLYTANDITVNYVYSVNKESATIKYIDVDTNQQVGNTATTTGVYQGKSDYQVTIPEGYILAPQKNPNDEFTVANNANRVFNQDGVVQNFNVYIVKQNSIKPSNIFQSSATIHYLDINTGKPVNWMSTVPYSEQSNPTADPTQNSAQLVQAGRDYVYKVWTVGVTSYQPGNPTPTMTWYTSTQYNPQRDGNGNPIAPALTDVLNSQGQPINGWTRQTTDGNGSALYPQVPGYDWVKATQLNSDGTETPAGDKQYPNGRINDLINLKLANQSTAITPQNSVYNVYYKQHYVFSNRQQKTARERINYLDITSKTPIASPYTTEKTVTFETVTDASNTQRVYYYKGSGTPATDNHPFNADGSANPDWDLADRLKTSFPAQNNPTINKYNVVSADKVQNATATAPYLTDDKKQVTEQPINQNFDEVGINVYYAQDGQYIQLPFTGGPGISYNVVMATLFLILLLFVQAINRIRNKKRN